jgi:hypothetical protein
MRAVAEDQRREPENPVIGSRYAMTIGRQLPGVTALVPGVDQYSRTGLHAEYIETTGAVLAGRDGFDSAIGDS